MARKKLNEDSTNTKAKPKKLKSKLKRNKREKSKCKTPKSPKKSKSNDAFIVTEEIVPNPIVIKNNLSLLNVLELICEWEDCLKKFEDSTTDLFGMHITKHSKNLQSRNGKFACLWSQCKFITSCKDHMTRHLSYHEYHTILKLKGRKFAVERNIPICSKDTSNVNTIPDSLTSKKFICQYNECENEYPAIIPLIEHVKLHCSFDFESSKNPDREKVIIQCGWNKCDRKFSSNNRLQEHIRTHTHDKQISCFQCGQFFATKIKFSDHCQSQEANKNQQYQCNQCYKYFANKRLLQCHYYGHYNFFKCTMCDMTCSTKNILIQHIRHRHLGVRPFECNQCSKKFIVLSDLKTHIARVHENIPYECDWVGCNFKSNVLRNVKRHVAEVHTNSAIIYACHECDKVYNRGDALSRHLKQMHKFQLPSGHKRFTYRQDENGIYRFQATRIETLEVINQKTTESACVYEISEIVENNPEPTDDSVIKVEADNNYIQIFNIKTA